MIEKLSPNDKEGIEKVASMHRQVLPWSVLSVFGIEFLMMYYQNALKSGSLCCLVHKEKREIVGFITFSKDSSKVLFEILKKRFFLFITLLSKSLLKNPKKIKTALSSAYFVLATQGKILPSINAEIMAFAVLPDFRRKNIGSHLFKAASKSLKDFGAKNFKVQTEQENTPANKFYSGHGCVLAENRFWFLGSRLNVYKGIL